MNVSGHRIGTADVEGSLIRHPSVGEAAVIGLPDPIKGERIKAFVVLRKGVEEGHGLVASLKDHVRQDLGPIAQPSEIEVRDMLPKTRSGQDRPPLPEGGGAGRGPGRPLDARRLTRVRAAARRPPQRPRGRSGRERNAATVSRTAPRTGVRSALDPVA